jgi:hypothetical protein
MVLRFERNVKSNRTADGKKQGEGGGGEENKIK